jgi:hypothetical protein
MKNGIRWLGDAPETTRTNLWQILHPGNNVIELNISAIPSKFLSKNG